MAASETIVMEGRHYFVPANPTGSVKLVNRSIIIIIITILRQW